MTISPLSTLLLKRTTLSSPLLARRILTVSASSTASLPARRLLPSSLISPSTRSYAVIEPITRPKAPTPAAPVEQTSPAASSSSSSSSSDPAPSSSPHLRSELEFSDQIQRIPELERPKRKKTAFERYLARGLPGWAMAFIIVYWTWHHFYEDIMYTFYGPKNLRNTEDAIKMEKATLARDAYLAQLEEEARAKSAAQGGRRMRREEVSFLPGAQVMQVEKELKEKEKEGGKSWYRRLF